MQRPKVIFFDIGGVLIELNVLPVIKEMASVLGVAPEKLDRSMDSGILHAFERGEITFEEYHRYIINHWPNRANLPLALFHRLWVDVLGPPTAVTDLLPALKEQAQVWLLSNTNRVHMEDGKGSLPFMTLADGRILSHEVGSRKPEATIYKTALKMAGIKADEAIFIDDRQDNIEAALKVGIRGHTYQSLSGLEIFLRDNGFSLPG